jgi:galactitol-specific phosphotransferase system IIB component
MHDLDELYKGRTNVKHHKLKQFAGTHFRGTDMMEYIEAQLDKHKWTTRIALLVKYGIKELDMKMCSLRERLKSKDDADIIVTNVHQAKGLEFDVVQLGKDFTTLVINNKPIVKKDPLQYNLLYVAITRAKHTLIINDTLGDFLQYLNEFQMKYTKRKIHESVSCENCSTLAKYFVKVPNEHHCFGYKTWTRYTTYELCEKCLN